MKKLLLLLPLLAILAGCQKQDQGTMDGGTTGTDHSATNKAATNNATTTP